MPSHEERALELVEFQDSLRALSEPVVTELQEAIAQALEDVEREAIAAERSRVIEECAKVAESVATGTSNIAVHERRGVDKAAAAIRDLGKQTGGADANS